jgi:hypothetical protein
MRLRAAQPSPRSAAVDQPTLVAVVVDATVAAPPLVFPPTGTPDAAFVAPPLSLPLRSLPDETLAATPPDVAAPIARAPVPQVPVPPPPIAAALLDMTAPLEPSALPRPRPGLPAPRRTLPPPPSRSSRPPLAHVEWTAGARDGQVPPEHDPGLPLRGRRDLPS